MQEETRETKNNATAAPAKEAPKSKKVPAPAKKAPKTPAVKEKKPKKKVSGGAIFSIFLIVLIIAAGVVVYMNVGGLRQKVVSLLQTEESVAADEALITDAAQLEGKKAELDALAAELEKGSADNKQKSQELKDKESLLSDKETELAAREATVADTQALLEQTQQEMDARTSAAQIFEQMDAVAAAKAISGLSSVNDMVELLLGMSSDKAAVILANMDAKLASQVLSEMMK